MHFFHSVQYRLLTRGVILRVVDGNSVNITSPLLLKKLWCVLIRISMQGASNEYQQHRFFMAE